MRPLIVGTLFACGWALYGASRLPPILAIIIGVIALAVSVAIIGVARRSAAALAKPLSSTARWLFLLNLLGEIILLNIAYFLTTGSGRPDLMIPAISAAVGLHFVPMTAIFGQSRYLPLAAMMLIVAALAAAAIAWTGLPAGPIATLEAFANALLLWSSTAPSALRARSRSRLGRAE
ncbi:MAG TPA: hypothetical protein VFL92_08445 [Sphingomonas sp.]|nr:hypothetical protein [Sphingomonas sp.]